MKKSAPCEKSSEEKKGDHHKNKNKTCSSERKSDEKEAKSSSRDQSKDKNTQKMLEKDPNEKLDYKKSTQVDKKVEATKILPSSESDLLKTVSTKSAVHSKHSSVIIDKKAGSELIRSHGKKSETPSSLQNSPQSCKVSCRIADQL